MLQSLLSDLRYRAALPLLAAALGVGPAAAADPYPTRPVLIVNPWTAGGPAEGLIRPIAERLTERLGQPFLIESRAGANGTIGSAAVARAKPDGYTLLFSHVGPITISPALPNKPPYDSVKDFVPITQITSGATVLVVRPDFPAKTMTELIAYAKANPGKVTYGSVGVGSTTHMAGAVLGQRTGTDLVHVPYKGSAPINTDLIGGQITMAFVNAAGVMPLIKDGRLRPIAVSTLKRTAVLPDVPTVAELLPGFEINSWFGLMAPAGTSPAIVNKLQKEVADILKSPDIIARFTAGAQDPEGTSPEAYAEKIRSDLKMWADAVKAANITE